MTPSVLCENRKDVANYVNCPSDTLARRLVSRSKPLSPSGRGDVYIIVPFVRCLCMHVSHIAVRYNQLTKLLLFPCF